MNTRWKFVAMGFVMFAFGAPSYSRAQVQDPLQYELRSGSVLQYGCFGPCACPIVYTDPVKGGFTLHRTGVDPLYTHYAVLNISWTYTVGGGTPASRTVHVTGHGTYDLGGEFALMQRMTLDLTTGDTLVQHFDSGMVPPRANFPAIDVDVRLRVNECIDSVFTVRAAPVTASVDAPSGAGLIHRTAPNPSSRGVEVTLSLPTPGPVRVDVVDLQGRVVARLLDQRLAAGERSVLWDGRDSNGADAGAGIFWVRARAGARIDRQRIARLR